MNYGYKLLILSAKLKKINARKDLIDTFRSKPLPNNETKLLSVLGSSLLILLGLTRNGSLTQSQKYFLNVPCVILTFAWRFGKNTLFTRTDYQLQKGMHHNAEKIAELLVKTMKK